ncbi:unnamed protein product [Triticum turgidum subsp. durum]|nr:unnamed protein product [Triticum turgidum subsp. durum]
MQENTKYEYKGEDGNREPVDGGFSITIYTAEERSSPVLPRTSPDQQCCQTLLCAWARARRTLKVRWTTFKAAYKARDDLLWWHNLAQCNAGELSMAYVQANHLMEDHCRVESSPTLGTFVGIFDGHGGPEVARFTAEHLFPNLQPKATCRKQAVTAETIRMAFLDTDESFIALVEKQWAVTPNLAAVGSCCLVGVVHQRTLFVANLGNSRAVLGKVDLNGGICPVQLSTEHVASDENVRQELRAQHPDDPHIVVLKHDHWRVKGIQQVSRTIGDAYLKHQRFNREPLHSRFRLREPFSRPILSAEPSIISYSLKPSDRFIIFASDGLWEFLSNEEAIEIFTKMSVV